MSYSDITDLRDNSALSQFHLWDERNPVSTRRNSELPKFTNTKAVKNRGEVSPNIQRRTASAHAFLSFSNTLVFEEKRTNPANSRLNMKCKYRAKRSVSEKQAGEVA